MESQPLSINELKDAFVSLKINKSPRHDGVSFNPFSTNVPLLYPLKVYEYLRFSVVFRGYGGGSLKMG